MSGIGGADLGKSEILNIERVKKENVNQSVESMKKSAEVDGNSNVILVKEDGNEAVVANVKLDNSLNLSTIALEKEGKLGNFGGAIKFFDNGSDDKQVLDMKTAEAMKPKPANSGETPVVSGETKPVQETEQANSEENIYKLSLDQSYKFISTINLIVQDCKRYPEDINDDMKGIKKDLTSREKIEVLKSVQESGKEDGKWGVSTFTRAKSDYNYVFNRDVTDKQFRKLIDDVIKFYDGGISYEALNKKYQFGPQPKK